MPTQMTQKFLIAIVSILVFAAILSAVVLNVQKRERERQQAEMERQQEVERQEQEQQTENWEKEGQVESGDEGEVRPPDFEDWKDATWKLYRDKENGFEIQYPDSHFIDEEFGRRQGLLFCVRHKDTVRYLSELDSPFVGDINFVGVSLRENKKGLNLLEWAKINNELYSLECNSKERPERIKCEEGGIDTQAEYLKIDSNKALLIRENSIESNSIVLFTLNNKLVEFYLHGSDIDSNEGDNFFAKMLESFKTID